MPKTFAELMEQFRNPGETGLPETFATELEETYTEEIAIRDAAVQKRDADLEEIRAAKEESDKEVMRMKAVNYDLLVAAPKGDEVSSEIETTGGNEKSGVDSLFETR